MVFLQEPRLSAVQQGQRAAGGHQPQEVRPQGGPGPSGGGQVTGKGYKCSANTSSKG